MSEDTTQTYPPSKEFVADALASADLYEEAKADRLGVLGRAGSRPRSLEQATSPRRSTGRNPPFAKWFVDGELNVAYNCLDRHVEAGNGDRVAIHFEGEPGDTRTITYAELTDEVKQGRQRCSPSLGVGKGDRVAIYLPMIPEAVIAMLACARIGAVALGGLRRLLRRRACAPASTTPRPSSSITADGGYRRGQARPRSSPPSTRRSPRARRPVENVLVVKRTGETTSSGPTAATCGGTTCRAASTPSTRPSRSTPSTRCSSSTPPAPRASPRASCTPPAAT